MGRFPHEEGPQRAAALGIVGESGDEPLQADTHSLVHRPPGRPSLLTDVSGVRMGAAGDLRCGRPSPKTSLIRHRRWGHLAGRVTDAAYGVDVAEVTLATDTVTG